MNERKAGGMLYGTAFSAESIKVIAESCGISALHDEAAKELAEVLSIKVKEVVQTALKFRNHARRRKMILHDIDSALKVKKLGLQFGYIDKGFVPFRFASGSGRELHFTDEKEVELSEATSSNVIKIPPGVSLRSHWLAVEGIQPTIPENPPPLSKEMQALEAVNPLAKLEHSLTKDAASKPTTAKMQKLRNIETVYVKQLATHELSVEQQLYYKEITEACVGSDESRRGEALQSLALDPGLYEMLPRMCTFIAEGVKVNVVQNNLALLIYLMRMVKGLLDNSTLYLEKYLHELIPSILTCIVSKQLCMRPELDNHWALRDFASRLMAQICKSFNTTTNSLQTRVTRIYSKALLNDKMHLSTLYGSIAGLSELGGEVIKVFIIPRLRFISERIESHLLGTSQSNTEKTAAGHIRAMLQKICPSILKQIRLIPDYPEEYRNEFGFLGPSLCQAVIKLRHASLNSPNSCNVNLFLTPSSSGRSSVQSSIHRQTSTSSTITSQASQQYMQSPTKIVYLPPHSNMHQLKSMSYSSDSMDIDSIQQSIVYQEESDTSSTLLSNSKAFINDVGLNVVVSSTIDSNTASISGRSSSTRIDDRDSIAGSSMCGIESELDVSSGVGAICNIESVSSAGDTIVNVGSDFHDDDVSIGTGVGASCDVISVDDDVIMTSEDLNDIAIRGGVSCGVGADGGVESFIGTVVTSGNEISNTVSIDGFQSARGGDTINSGVCGDVGIGIQSSEQMNCD